MLATRRASRDGPIDSFASPAVLRTAAVCERGLGFCVGGQWNFAVRYTPEAVTIFVWGDVWSVP